MLMRFPAYCYDKLLLDCSIRALMRTILMNLQQVSQREWRSTANGAVYRFVPFTEVGSEPYTTYLRTT